MDKQYIEDNEISIKYLRKQLTPEEVEEFEIYLMENPEALEQLDLDSLFQTRLRDLAPNAYVSAEPITKTPVSPKWFGLPNIIAFLSGALLIFVFGLEKNELETPNLIYLSQTRSGGVNIDQLSKIEVGGKEHIVVVLNLPKPVDFPVDVLIKPFGSEVDNVYKVVRRITPDEPTTITLLLKEDSFLPDKYQIQVLDSSDTSRKLFVYGFETHRL